MGGPAARRPTVSVVVPAWNVEPWLDECLTSVARQTLGLDRIQLIVVDDGSTDATGAMLDAFAAANPWALVVHQPASGGPGAPRNAGLALATGDYLFFLDADDYLGPEALERMVAMAERNGSDIVLGKVVGVGGRRLPRGSYRFRRDLDHADVELVRGSGSVLKLFRRSFWEREGFRFPPDLVAGEDGEVMQRAYPAAGRISVIASYDCYFQRLRAGSQTNRRDRVDDIGEAILRIERERIRVAAAAHRGVAREIAVAPIVARVALLFGSRWRDLPPDDRTRVFETGAGVIDRWCTPRIRAVIQPRAAIRVWCLAERRQDVLLDIVAARDEAVFHGAFAERGRVYAAYPHFRDGSGIPDACFDITRLVGPEATLERAAVVDGRLELAGTAWLRLVGGSVTVELRRWPRGPRHRVATEPIATPELRDATVHYAMAGYRASIDLGTVADGAPLPAGSWDMRLVVGSDAVHRTVALEVPRGARGAVMEGVVGAVGDARLRVTAGRALRLVVGRQAPLAGGVLALEDAVRGSSRRAVGAGARALERTRPGRLALLGLEAYRPGTTIRLLDG
jgi:poly(ribitol-phosphate) beta-N-acetylglucosaminyltransferase